MRPRLARWTLLGLLSAIPATGMLPTPASGQAGAASVSFTGRVQTQFNTTSADDPVASEFLIRRARITAVIEVWNPAVGDHEWSLKIQSYIHF
jgi:hypothetical protein